MAEVLLKTGETVTVPIEEIEDYLYENADKIQTRTFKRRGPVRKHSYS